MNENLISYPKNLFNNFLQRFGLKRKFDKNISYDPNSKIRNAKRATDEECPINYKMRNLNYVKVAIPSMSNSDINTFTTKIQSYFNCSKCKMPEKFFKQCYYGHIFCYNCVNDNGVYCEECDKMINSNELSMCTIPSNTHSFIQSVCEFCNNQYYQENLMTHQNEQCTRRITNCDFHIFGCLWLETVDKKRLHLKNCPFQNLKLKQSLEIYQNYINKQKIIHSSENAIFLDCLSKIRQQNNGLRLAIKEIILSKFQLSFLNNTIYCVKFVSPLFKLPLSCCVSNGFNLEFYLVIDKSRNTKRIRYIIKSENEYILKLYYCLISYSLIDNEENFPFTDQFHWHEFERGNEESVAYEIAIRHDRNDENIDKLINAKQIKLVLCILADDMDLQKSHFYDGIANQLEMDNFMSLFVSSMRTFDSDIDSNRVSSREIPRMVNTSND